MILAAAAAAAIAMTIDGPKGPIEGAFVDAGKGAPVLVIIPGSGPTNRDGNNPLGVKAAPYRLLAEALGAKGVSTLRADKRGMFGSKTAIPDPNAVTLADYAADAHNWARTLRQKTGARCVWLLGHSEGSLVALKAAQQPVGLCGIILASAPGRKLGDVLREQLHSNPANAPLLPVALPALASLEAGKSVDTSTMPAPLLKLFAPQVQPFLMDLLGQNPAAEVAATSLPVLIVQGTKDLQVSTVDAEALHRAQPKAELHLIPNMNHVLKDVAGDDRAANMASYADPSLPVDATLVDDIATFVKTKR
jgi:pimeloyl-ACP methyl ester carboxylesterase